MGYDVSDSVLFTVFVVWKYELVVNGNVGWLGFFDSDGILLFEGTAKFDCIPRYLITAVKYHGIPMFL